MPSENAFLPIAVWLEVSLRCSGSLGLLQAGQVQAGHLGIYQAKKRLFLKCVQNMNSRAELYGRNNSVSG